jgi:tetratricopeptide (TPR) repeat protein
MNYLSELISTLNETELGGLTALNLQGREAEVFNAFVALVSNVSKNKSVSPEQLGISPTHFDKVCSILIDKILTHVASEKFEDKANFILQKGLSRMLLHEIKINHRVIANSKDKKTKREFYTTAFETMRKMSFDVLEFKLLRQYANHLKPLLKSNDHYSPEVVEFKYVYIENAFHFLNGEGISYAPQALKNIHLVISAPEKYKTKVCYVYYHLCISGYYKDFEDNQSLALHHAQIALEHIKRFSKGTDNAVMVSAYGMYANILCNQSNFNEALITYNQAFKDFPAEMEKSYYHTMLYCITALVCNEYDLTEKLLEKYMRPFTDNSVALYYRFESFRLFILHRMFQRKFDEALVFLRELQSIKRKDLTDTAYIFLRMIENLYTLITHDYELAITQSKNNMKFLTRKNFTYENCDYLDLFYTIGALAKMKLNNKVNREALEPHLTKSNRGFMKMYGGLMEQVLN